MPVARTTEANFIILSSKRKLNARCSTVVLLLLAYSIETNVPSIVKWNRFAQNTVY